MNKAELIAAVAAAAEISKKDAETAVTATLDTITTALKEGDKVQLVGFGSFEVKSRAARTGRNPPHQGSRGDPRFQGSRVQGRQGSQGRRR